MKGGIELEEWGRVYKIGCLLEVESEFQVF